MPNITMYVDIEAMPPGNSMDSLTTQCTDLCTGTLRAALDNVHIIYVPVRRGRGHPVFAEVLFREEPFRTPEVMDRFMQQLDDAITTHTGRIARIRCFSFGKQHIHARN
ncbi:hypothetical protein HC031_09990 [Planosporangium thailandense]|uniref:Uncharacterized protein n=1 Tax=Planosporangium thailandense TaxID=765197 RepID=A0ABX0XVH1_9ACTN|nr:hypothetical protein [Planosporangium thailandense]NJC70036.1 hypothetical protein [Planosporangium thailandense]